MDTRFARRLVRSHRRTPALLAAVIVATVAQPWPRDVLAQRVDSTRVGARAVPDTQARQQPAPNDSVRPPISPRRAFLYSFLLPGYGQSVLDRPLAGTLFATVELTSLALARKAIFDLRYARAHARDSIVATYRTRPDGSVEVDSAGRPVPNTYVRNRYAGNRVSARKKHVEDYYALLVANHLLAGAEAFVAAQLWDLPTRVSIRALPFGPVIAATVRW